MPYTNNNGADETVPNGAAVAANTLDTVIQDVKRAYNERLATAFGGTWGTSTEANIDKIFGCVTFNGTGKQANQPVGALGNITGATTIDFDVRGNYITATLIGNVTFTFSNLRAGTTYVLVLTQDGVGGRTVGWPATLRWPGGTTPTLNTTASRASLITITPISGSIALGGLSGTNYNVS